MNHWGYCFWNILCKAAVSFFETSIYFKVSFLSKLRWKVKFMWDKKKSGNYFHLIEFKPFIILFSSTYLLVSRRKINQNVKVLFNLAQCKGGFETFEVSPFLLMLLKILFHKEVLTDLYSLSLSCQLVFALASVICF